MDTYYVVTHPLLALIIGAVGGVLAATAYLTAKRKLFAPTVVLVLTVAAAAMSAGYSTSLPSFALPAAFVATLLHCMVSFVAAVAIALLVAKATGALQRTDRRSRQK